MFFVNPFFLRIDGVPEDQFSVHPSWSHELQFWHCNHTCYEQISFFFSSIFFFPFREGFLEVCFEIPHIDASIFLPTIKNFIDGVPGQRVDLCTKMMFEGFFLVVWLSSHDDAILSVFPSPDVSITRGNQQQFIFFIRQIEHIEDSYTCGEN